MNVYFKKTIVSPTTGESSVATWCTSVEKLKNLNIRAAMLDASLTHFTIACPTRNDELVWISRVLPQPCDDQGNKLPGHVNFVLSAAICPNECIRSECVHVLPHTRIFRIEKVCEVIDSGQDFNYTFYDDGDIKTIRTKILDTGMEIARTYKPSFYCRDQLGKLQNTPIERQKTTAINTLKPSGQEEYTKPYSNLPVGVVLHFLQLHERAMEYDTYYVSIVQLLINYANNPSMTQKRALLDKHVSTMKKFEDALRAPGVANHHALSSNLNRHALLSSIDLPDCPSSSSHQPATPERSPSSTPPPTTHTESNTTADDTNGIEEFLASVFNDNESPPTTEQPHPSPHSSPQLQQSSSDSNDNDNDNDKTQTQEPTKPTEPPKRPRDDEDNMRTKRVRVNDDATGDTHTHTNDDTDHFQPVIASPPHPSRVVMHSSRCDEPVVIVLTKNTLPIIQSMIQNNLQPNMKVFWEQDGLCVCVQTYNAAKQLKQIKYRVIPDIYGANHYTPRKPYVCEDVSIDTGAVTRRRIYTPRFRKPIVDEYLLPEKIVRRIRLDKTEFLSIFTKGIVHEHVIPPDADILIAVVLGRQREWLQCSIMYTTTDDDKTSYMLYMVLYAYSYRTCVQTNKVFVLDDMMQPEHDISTVCPLYTECAHEIERYMNMRPDIQKNMQTGFRYLLV